MTEQKNLILAILLSVGIILAFQYFFEAPRMREAQRQAAQEQAQTSEIVPPSPATGVPGTAGPTAAPAGRPAAVEETPRVPIDNGRLHGSVPLAGKRIDDVTLADYHVTVDPSSPDIVLFSPPGSEHPYFAEFGWVAGDKETVVPDAGTDWQVQGDKLTADQPLVYRWDNGNGLSFSKTLKLDKSYLFTVSQSVTNTSDRPVTVYPYGLISRWGTPTTLGYYILHEGPIGVVDQSLKEIDYDDLREDGPQEFKTTGGWMGITDKYWLAALVPAQDASLTATFRHVMVDNQSRYQVDYLRDPVTVQPGQTVEVGDHLFAGAKEVNLLDAYSDQYGIPLFDRAVDFGWFYFLTKPIFHVLDYFYRVTGNYGIAILLLTLIVKLLFFPLANKSYRAMSKMKKLQPEMQKLRERFGDDKVRMNQELMALYKKEQVNPMAGCLPILIQIPVFFALYKVLFVNIEMRHAPFFGWIHDLSAPDPTTVFNLFGLIPWDPPSFLMIGVWPLLMGLTMFLQTKLNPQPADPVQAKVMLFLPVMFTFLFATFPAGLVIYWTWNNILSIAQQWVIMRRMGVPAS
jgi:YidC/Oxa1 family membrane protein insertase